ncbi:MAG: polysaccharide lyase [Bacteroidales bacterium]|nr:polysaccharide lyase [Bacteroidales bacterium]
MLNKRIALLRFVLLLAIIDGYAQYPSMKNVQPIVDYLQQEWDSLDAIAWEKAWPDIFEDTRNFKVYHSWAHRPDDLPQASIPAFPGAEGGGMYSFGGRGGKVFVVTSLDDSGSGTFREACEHGGSRVVVFNVAGIIRLERPISINAPYITIAGQTSPGDGICIAGESVYINTQDVVIRHVRFRRGETWVGRRDDAIGGDPVGNIIIDHVSASWGLDENMTLYRHKFTDSPGNPKAPVHKYGTVNITIQNCIFSEALDTYGHAFGSTLGGENCLFIRNLWANNTGRNPSIGWNGTFNFVNNVVYNWYHRSVDGGDFSSRYNIINNYYKPGPVTPSDQPVGYRLLKPASRYKVNGRTVYGRVWVEGNTMEGYPEITNDNWKGIQIEDMADAGDYLSEIRWYKRFDMPEANIINAGDAYKFVLSNAGATLPKRDAVDERVINQVRTNKIDLSLYKVIDTLYQFEHRRLEKDSYKYGIITDIAQVGGYPEYYGEPRKDTDMDGMPDEWEKKYKLNPKDPADAVLDCNGDGYTNIEKYINGIDPAKKVDWKDLKNNKDTLAEKGRVL